MRPYPRYGAHLLGVRDDWADVTAILARDSAWFGQLISHRYALEDALAPFEMMRARERFFCKVMYVMDAEARA